MLQKYQATSLGWLKLLTEGNLVPRAGPAPRVYLPCEPFLPHTLCLLKPAAFSAHTALTWPPSNRLSCPWCVCLPLQLACIGSGRIGFCLRRAQQLGTALLPQSLQARQWRQKAAAALVLLWRLGWGRGSCS